MKERFNGYVLGVMQYEPLSTVNLTERKESSEEMFNAK